MWVLIIVVALGTFTPDVKLYQIDFTNKEACITAMNNFNKQSGGAKNVAYECISRDTGEVLRP